MPEGVEHYVTYSPTNRLNPVSIPQMPKGVEHIEHTANEIANWIE